MEEKINWVQISVSKKDQEIINLMKELEQINFVALSLTKSK